MLNTRDILSKDMLEHLSNIIQYRVLSSNEFKMTKIIGAYYPIGSEVKMDKILDYAINNKILALPKIKEGIIFARINDMARLAKGKYGILEPIDDDIVNPDLIIVPGIVFDEQGYRIGYGKGYYDKYLSKNRCYSIGVAYDFQVLREIPHDMHDIKLDMIITDKRIITI